jgi:hypothetical protein
MRNTLLLLMVVFFYLGHGQVTDNFTDGDLSQNPTWSGNVGKFTVENEMLRSNSGTSSDLFYISTPNTLATDCQWDILVNMQFNTSSANYTDLVLLCDTANPSLAKAGYFLRIGNTKDELALYKISSSGPVLLADGADGKTENKNIRIRVIRSDIGNWQILADYSGGSNYIEEINITDNETTTTSYFALAVRQSTASFFNKHFFDDIKIGPIERDTIAPTATGLTVLTNNQVTVNFSEPLQTPRATNFTLDKGIGVPISIDSAGANGFTLTFGTSFGNDTYNLAISNIKDLAGNQLDTTLQFQYVVYNEPEYGDILINEIFADPTPSLGLPEEEFIEIYNNSNKQIQLEACTFSDGGTPAILPSFPITPGEYVVICKNTQEIYKNNVGRIITVSNFPALNNTGDALVLKNAKGEILDSVTYTDKWYKDDLKAQGGYTIERIDFATNCSVGSNWIASADPTGGTPGKQNSVYAQNPDTIAPKINQFYISSNTITLQLTEALVANLASDLGNFELAATQENPISIALSDGGKSMELAFASTFVQNRAYTLKINELADCISNSISDVELGIFYFTTEINENDIIINELLFNPLADGVDFIELYNPSDKFINLENLKLGRQVNDTTKEYKSIGQFYVLQPQHYVAISTDSLKVKNNYTKAVNQLQISSLPSMNNDAGSVLLADANGNILDSVSYNEDQHFELLSSVDGVSLERLSFTQSSTNPANWHSASASVNYATPGYQNSQFIDLTKPNATFELQSKTVSPDADGYEDALILNYALDNVGYTLNAYVFDLSGRLIHHPINNETLSTTGFISWDGINANGEKVPVGNYILLVEAFNLDGKVIKKKLAFSIVGVF